MLAGFLAQWTFHYNSPKNPDSVQYSSMKYGYGATENETFVVETLCSTILSTTHECNKTGNYRSVFAILSSLKNIPNSCKITFKIYRFTFQPTKIGHL